MKRTIEISASFTGVIPTGSYENEKPFFHVKETVEGTTEEVYITDIMIRKRQKELHQMCYDQFKAQAEVSYQERIAKQYQNIRWYDFGGKKVPSVTSITGLDKEFHIPEDELAQYGCRGTIIHKQAEIFLNSGDWKEPKDIEECSNDYVTVVKGSLGLELDNVDFRAFYKKYPFTVLHLEKATVNDSYGGRIDIICEIDSKNKGGWEKIEGVVYDKPTILDIKTSSSLDKMTGLTQQSAYARSENIEQIGLIHLTKDNKCGYAKPVITLNVERYYSLFDNKRDIFRKRFGL